MASSTCFVELVVDVGAHVLCLLAQVLHWLNLMAIRNNKPYKQEQRRVRKRSLLYSINYTDLQRHRLRLHAVVIDDQVEDRGRGFEECT